MENKTQSWSGIFNDFISNPPTASVFRLYLLSLLIWNESAILYLAFHNQSMYDKLKNFYEFVPYPHNVYSLYLGPLIPLTIIYLIVFYKIRYLKVNNETKSVYDYLFYKHQTSLENRLRKETAVVNAQAAKLESEIKLNENKEKLEESVGKDFARFLEDIKI